MLKHGLAVLLASVALAAHAQSPAPAVVAWEIEVVRDGRSVWVRVRSVERSANFKRPRLH